MDCYRVKGQVSAAENASRVLFEELSGVEDEDMEVDGEDDEALLMLFY